MVFEDEKKSEIEEGKNGPGEKDEVVKPAKNSVVEKMFRRMVESSSSSKYSSSSYSERSHKDAQSGNKIQANLQKQPVTQEKEPGSASSVSRSREKPKGKMPKLNLSKLQSA